MVIHSFIDKSNTIIYNTNTNTGLNSISELFFGGFPNNGGYSRLLLHFDETRLKSLFTGGVFTDLTKLKHTLRMTNTGSFDKDLLNGTMGSKKRASSFDLICFKINQPFDGGVGFDYEPCQFLDGKCAFSNGPSNWIFSQSGIDWSGGTGVYSGSPSGITVSTQHFDKGNEAIVFDITDYVNDVISGATTNFGLGIAYARPFELMSTSVLQFVGFFTNNSQTFFEPFIESIYSNHIKDDRNNFFLDKPNKLYLYSNLGGNPTNLDFIPSVNVFDQDGVLFSAFTSSAVTHVTKGVYSIDITVPTTSTNDCTMYTDTWTGISINNVIRPDIELNFAMKNSSLYYNIGDNDSLPKKIGVSISGIQSKERVKKGDIKKVIVSARIPFSVEQSQIIDGLQYRIYVKEGTAELTVIDFQPVEMTNNNNYFLLDTASLITNTYYLDILVTSNLEVTTIKNAIQFDIVNQVELRKGQ